MAVLAQSLQQPLLLLSFCVVKQPFGSVHLHFFSSSETGPIALRPKSAVELFLSLPLVSRRARSWTGVWTPPRRPPTTPASSPSSSATIAPTTNYSRFRLGHPRRLMFQRLAKNPAGIEELMRESETRDETRESEDWRLFRLVTSLTTQVGLGGGLSHFPSMLRYLTELL